MKTITIMFNEKKRQFNILPETQVCVGCVAENDQTLCNQLNEFNCYSENIIFVETSIEQTFTLDQIKNAWEATWGEEPGVSFLHNLRNLKQES